MTCSILKEVASYYNSRNSNVYACFIDLRKAFDRVNHSLLFDKLIDRNYHPSLIKIIINMYSRQYVHITFNNVNSDKWKVGNGVRQGGILSPALFNFYINDVIEAISELNVGCKLHFYRLNILAFADDIILVCPSANGLQFLIDKFVNLIEKLSLCINEKKTVAMIIKCKLFRNVSIKPVFCIKNTIIEIVSKHRYLGVMFMDNLSIIEDIRKCNKTFLKQFYNIWRKFSYTDFEVFKFLFTSHCTSFFGCELWFDIKGSTYEYHVMEVTYHKAIKKMLGLPWRFSNHIACEVAGLPIFNHFINKRILCFLFNMIQTTSPCILPLRDYFMYDSHLVKSLSLIFNESYSVNNILNNNQLALKSRIDFVQRHEPHSNYGLFII